MDEHAIYSGNDDDWLYDDDSDGNIDGSDGDDVNDYVYDDDEDDNNTQLGGRQAIGGALPAIRVGGFRSALVCALLLLQPDGKPDSHTF